VRRQTALANWVPPFHSWTPSSPRRCLSQWRKQKTSEISRLSFSCWLHFQQLRRNRVQTCCWMIADGSYEEVAQLSCLLTALGGGYGFLGRRTNSHHQVGSEGVANQEGSSARSATLVMRWCSGRAWLINV
jgi:hypothetical protein